MKLTEIALPALSELKIQFGDNAARYTITAVTNEEQRVSAARMGILRILRKN